MAGYIGCPNQECIRQFLRYGDECDGSDDEHTHCSVCNVRFCRVCPACESEWAHSQCASCLGMSEFIYNNGTGPVAVCARKCWEAESSESD